MLRTICALSVLAFVAQSADAGFLLDDFEAPLGAPGQQSGTSGTPTGQSLSAPNFFTDGNSATDERFLLGATVSGGMTLSSLEVVNGDLEVFLANAGDVAYIEWTNPSAVPTTFAGLELIDYSPTLVNADYDVTLNGTSIGSGAFSNTPGNFVLGTSQQTFLAAGDLLRITITANGLTIFDAEEIRANPEPASAGLLGLLLLGGGVRYRRKRSLPRC